MDTSAGRLKEIFKVKAWINVIHPGKKAEIRITGLDYTFKQADVPNAIAGFRNCSVEYVPTGNIEHRTPLSMGSVWIRCLATAAKKIVEAKRMTV